MSRPRRSLCQIAAGDSQHEETLGETGAHPGGGVLVTFEAESALDGLVDRRRGRPTTPPRMPPARRPDARGTFDPPSHCTSPLREFTWSWWLLNCMMTALLLDLGMPPGGRRTRMPITGILQLRTEAARR